MTASLNLIENNISKILFVRRKIWNVLIFFYRWTNTRVFLRDYAGPFENLKVMSAVSVDKSQILDRSYIVWGKSTNVSVQYIFFIVPPFILFYFLFYSVLLQRGITVQWVLPVASGIAPWTPWARFRMHPTLHNKI